MLRGAFNRRQLLAAAGTGVAAATLRPRRAAADTVPRRVPRVGSLGGQLYVLNMGISEDTAWMRHAGNRVTARPVFC